MTTTGTKNWELIGRYYWRSALRADLTVSLNGTGTMWTVETETQIGDFFVATEAWDVANRLATEAR